MSDVTYKITSVERIKQAIEHELDKSDWEWDEFLSSLLDHVQSKIDGLQNLENRQKSEQRKILLKAQALYLDLGQQLQKLSNE